MKNFSFTALIALAVFMLFSVADHSARATTSNNTASYLNYAPQAQPFGNFTNSNAQWWALPGQPTKTFHRVTVRDSSGCVIALGHGTSPNQVVDLYVGGSGGASTHEIEYPFGLSYGGSASCVWWKRISCEPVSGEQIVNFIY